jgi:PAS domain S-box-containing protein
MIQPSSQASILVVEDEAIVAADLVNKIESLGYRSAGSVNSAETAIVHVQREPPSLLLMDIRLSGRMDGIQAAELIHREYELPVVFITAHTDTNTVSRATKAGAFGYILKPFDIRELKTAIEMSLFKHAADQRLRNSERQFRALFEGAGDGIFIADSAGRYVDVNARGCELTGYSREEILARSIVDLVAVEEHPLVSAAVAHVLSGRPHISEWTFVRKDGSFMPGEVNAQLLPDGRVIGILRDLTERERAAEALRTSEERLRLALEGARLAMWDWHIPSGKVIWNEEHYRMLGYEPGSFAPNYRHWADRLHPEDRQATEDAIQQVMRSNKGEYTTQFRVCWADGTERWIEARGRFHRNEVGQALRCYGVMMDITSRKQSEQALLASELRFRRLTESNIIGVIIVESGFIIEVNNVFLSIIGSSPDQFKPRTVTWLDITPLDCHEQDQHKLAELIAYGACRPFEKELIGPGGTVPVLVGASLLTKAPLTWIGFVLDLTQLKHAEQESRLASEELQVANEELRIANEDLEQRVARRTVDLEQRTLQLRALAGELTRAEEHERRRVAGVLHDDLQQLLAAARFALDNLCYRHKKQELHSDCQKIVYMLSQAMEVSRSLTAELCPSVLYHEGLARSLQWLSAWYEEKHGLKVNVVIQASINVPAEAIRIALFHCVRELLFNVVKHAAVKSATVTLSLTRNGDVQITVVDHGVGFDPRKIHPEGSSSGRLGLFSLHERIALLGGRLEIESSPGAGSRFLIQVPMPTGDAVAPAQLVPSTEDTHEHLSPKPRTDHRIRVLIADDHAIVRDGLARALRDELDLNVVGLAADGEEALQLAEQLRPQVIVMDVNMPHLDGIAATRRVTAQLPEVRVIGLSMFNDDAHRSGMLNAGAVDYLDKSGPPAHLVAAIRKHMRRLNSTPKTKSLGRRQVSRSKQ